jgi:hypothetical protein
LELVCLESPCHDVISLQERIFLKEKTSFSPSAKVRKYRADYNNRSPSAVSFMPAIASTSASGVLSAQSDRGFYHYRRAVVSDQLKSKVGLALAKEAALRITLNLDGATIISRTHTHASHSQTTRLDCDSVHATSTVSLSGSVVPFEMLGSM